MVTKAAGGKITGLLALTMEAASALKIGDHVHLSEDYTVALADGTKPVLGTVSVSNTGRKVTRTDTVITYGVAEVPGAVTVEARGFYVETVLAGEDDIAAGDAVGIGAAGAVLLFDGVATVMEYGIALTGGDEGDKIDVLVR